MFFTMRADGSFDRAKQSMTFIGIDQKTGLFTGAVGGGKIPQHEDITGNIPAPAIHHGALDQTHLTRTLNFIKIQVDHGTNVIHSREPGLVFQGQQRCLPVHNKSTLLALIQQAAQVSGGNFDKPGQLSGGGICLPEGLGQFFSFNSQLVDFLTILLILRCQPFLFCLKCIDCLQKGFFVGQNFFFALFSLLPGRLFFQNRFLQQVCFFLTAGHGSSPHVLGMGRFRTQQKAAA